jgi:cell wall-associated NlpC family hydrolase
MQTFKKKLRRPKYRFWAAFSTAALLLLLEVVPKAAAYARVSPSAPVLPQEDHIRDDVVRQAQSFLNLPYRFGGASPNGFDCGGLILYLYRRHGFTMPHGVIYMRPTLRLTKTPKKGDVIFFLNDNNIVGHVGMYIDEERFIHAPKEGEVIRYEKLKHPYWKKRTVEIRSVF